MTKRILSLALAVVMAATTFSFSAFAADKKEEKKAEKQEISLKNTTKMFMTLSKMLQKQTKATQL